MKKNRYDDFKLIVYIYVLVLGVWYIYLSLILVLLGGLGMFLFKVFFGSCFEFDVDFIVVFFF